MSVGSKIRYNRKLRNLTQRELGVKAGFSASTADVRIRQYEYEKMEPKADILNRIADSLDVNVMAPSGNCPDSVTGLMHLLFDLEREYGVHPEKRRDGYLLGFESDGETGAFIQECLSDWYHTRKRYLQTIENKLADTNAYGIWTQQFHREER